MAHLPLYTSYPTSSVRWEKKKIILCLTSIEGEFVSHKMLGPEWGGLWAHSESAVLGEGGTAGNLHSWNSYFICWGWTSAFHPSTNPSPQKRQAGKFYQKIKIWLRVESWLWLELPSRTQVHFSNAASTYGNGWQLGIPWQGYLSSKSTNTVWPTSV